MRALKHFLSLTLLILPVLLTTGCEMRRYNGKLSHVFREPEIAPDYSGVTIPPNIAPLNFRIMEEAFSYEVIASSSNGNYYKLFSFDGKFKFSEKKWRKLLSEGRRLMLEVTLKDHSGNTTVFAPVSIRIAPEPADPFIVYRLLFPGYESWSRMRIIQRSVESFREFPLAENALLDDNCVNCHTFNNKDPEEFLIHVRGSKAGTYFVNGNNIVRRELRTPQMNANAVYPSWHPSGRYIAFSSNTILHSVHMIPDKRNEFYDTYSSLVIYDVERNEIMEINDPDTTGYMETFPFWSPDGKYLYYCRTRQVEEYFNINEVRYDLVRRSFEDSRNNSSPVNNFGSTQMVYDAGSTGKSLSFPSISPDGRYLVFVLHNYGTFSILHKESDLYIMDLHTGEVKEMPVNSNEPESYHSWSSNGKWLVFSSKRDDGVSARPYFAYVGSFESIGKPFPLPQKDPSDTGNEVLTYNRPEFAKEKIKAGPRDFERASSKSSIQAKWVSDTIR